MYALLWSGVLSSITTFEISRSDWGGSMTCVRAINWEQEFDHMDEDDSQRSSDPDEELLAHILKALENGDLILDEPPKQRGKIPPDELEGMRQAIRTAFVRAFGRSAPRPYPSSADIDELFGHLTEDDSE